MWNTSWAGDGHHHEHELPGGPGRRGVFIIAGQINRKIGARLTSGICCIISGVAYILACNAPSVVLYTVAMCFVYGGIMSAGYVAGGTLVATWFPKKKGVVMGYTTMGHNLASAFYVQLVAILIAPMVTGMADIGQNFKTGIVPIGVGAIVLGILGMLFIRNTPQERGINPDNVSDEVYAAEYDTTDEVRATAAGPPASCCAPRSCGWRPSPPPSSRSAPWA